MSEIDEIFRLLIKDGEDFIDTAAKTFLHNSTKAITETWARSIISALTDKSLTPPLDAATIKRRELRGKGILGPDYPLLESGDWITYIKFYVRQFEDHDELEVGVFDDVTQIGHTSDVTPSYIAFINEYGDEHTPARNLFTTSWMDVNSQIDSIIKDTWDSLIIPEVVEIQSLNSLVGSIIYDGSGFTFRWNA